MFSAKQKEKITQKKELESLLVACIEGVLEAKASDVKVIDLRGAEGGITSFFVICTSSSHTHAKTIYEKVEEQVLRQTAEVPVGVEGLESKEWILLDYFDVIVHIFSERAREFYALEELWGDFPQWEVDPTWTSEQILEQLNTTGQSQVTDE